MKKISLSCLLFLTFFLSQGQSSLVLSSYIQEGLQSNLALKQENLELEKSLKSIEIARANLFPKVSFTPTYSLALGGRSISLPIGDLLNPVYSTLNQLTKSSNFPQIENVNQLLAPNNFHDTKISFQYPIFNSDIKYAIALQKELFQTETAKKKAIEYELRHSIEIAYFQYLQALEVIKIYAQSRELLVEFVNLNQKLVENKVALKDVLLTSEYEVTKIDQQIAVAEKNKELAKAYFNFLLNKKLGDDITADTKLISQLPTVKSEEVYQYNARSNRPEFNQLQSGLRVNDAALLLQEKNAKLPQIFVGGNTGFQGFGYSFTKQAYVILQAGLQWDLFHGYEKKRKIEQTKISKSITEVRIEEVKKQVELQVNQSFKEVESAFLGLKTVQGGTAKTEKILSMVTSRYRNGVALPIEVYKAQTDDLQAKLSESIARFDVWIKFASLKKVSGIEL